jgi:glyoxylase I family protein
MVKGIEHTAIASPDPERLAQWYVDHLNFRINYKSNNSRTRFVKADDGTMIEIIESKGPVPGTSGMRDAGIRHMAITVTDFDAEFARLQGLGVAFLSEKQTSGGNSTVFFTDCDGNILHLLHREKPLD